MQVELITETKAKAKEKYDEYKKALEAEFHFSEDMESAYRELMSAYGHMRYGRSLIHIRQAFRDAGFDEDGWPKVALARVDRRQCYCARNSLGRVILSPDDFRSDAWGSIQVSIREEDIDLGPGFQTENRPGRYIVARTDAPLVPPKLLPESGVEDCYVLWEVEEWTVTRIPRMRQIPRDPMLLNRINGTIFAVLATWEMTDLERTILSGRLS